ncbi:MAG: ACT domain-containing protein [Christensenella sp.]|uniref:ACT domain-containing protein n=1 Tax=Christensenella sp. TaxID=1935934 RepID=UPI002B1EFB29|nr:ACT domain-containing protein [Christensenella sp.]MEA5004729.1 ACT domain-containing protein [Christensenella sp.]
MKIRVLDGTYAVGKLKDGSGVPERPQDDSFYSVTITQEEISIVCVQERMPPCEEIETDFALLKVEGILDFSLTGILAKISGVLAEAQVSIFCISTYNTDYVLVRRRNLERATQALGAHGYELII